MHETKPRWRPPRDTGFFLVCILVGVLATTVTQSFADDDPATQTITTGDLIVPYDGFLKIDGAGASAPARLRFELFEAPTGATPEWTEVQVVTMHNGRFSVGLGAVEPLKATVLDAEKLFLAITVLEDDGAGGIVEVALDGRQSIEPAPFAAWAAHAADFDVAGDLDVAGDARAGGDVRTGANLHIGGAGLFLMGTRSALSRDATDTLVLGSGPGLDTTRLQDVTRIDGDLSVGSLTIPRRVDVLGTLAITDRVEAGHLDLGAGAGTLLVSTLTGTNRGSAGNNGLKLYPFGSSTTGVVIDESGDVTFERGLRVKPTDLGPNRGPVLEETSSFRNVFLSRTNTRMKVLEGFCPLTGVQFTHGDDDPGRMGCRIQASNGTFDLQSIGSFTSAQPNKGAGVCGTRCTKFGVETRP